MVESSFKVAPKLLVQVRADAPRSSPVVHQLPSKPKSPQKRSTPPSTNPFTAYAPSHMSAPMPAWPHIQQQQRSPQMHVPPSMGLTSVDTQLMMDMQRQVSAAEMAAYTASMRAPVRTQSLPRLQQDARDSSKLQQRQAGQSGHPGQVSEPQRQAIMHQMSRMPPSWHQSQQPPAEARQLLPKQAAVHSAGARASPVVGGDMHPPRRHSVPASPVMGPHSGPFTFHPHSEAPALHQLMQQALSQNGFSHNAFQGQPTRSMGMPAGQMLGHPAVRPRPSPYAEPSLQRQMHVPAVGCGCPFPYLCKVGLSSSLQAVGECLEMHIASLLYIEHLRCCDHMTRLCRCPHHLRLCWGCLSSLSPLTLSASSL